VGVYFRNFFSILVHVIFLPLAKSIAGMTILMMAIHMLGTSSFAEALKQLLVRENYSEGVVFGGLVGFFKMLGAVGTVPLESNFIDVPTAIDGNDYINPATGLPLINPGAGAHGGIDIHNNWHGSSSNEF
jgi:hypothetical protein